MANEAGQVTNTRITARQLRRRQVLLLPHKQQQQQQLEMSERRAGDVVAEAEQATQ